MCYDRKEEAGWKQTAFANSCMFSLEPGWAEPRPGPAWMWEPVASWHHRLKTLLGEPQACRPRPTPCPARPPVRGEALFVLSLSLHSIPFFLWGVEALQLICQTEGCQVLDRASPQEEGFFHITRPKHLQSQSQQRQQGEWARQGHPWEIRKWRKAANCKEAKSPHDSQWDSSSYVCSTFPQLQLNLWAEDVPSFSLLLD